MSKFGVHVATWNVGSTEPPKDLAALVGLPESEYVIDILAVGLQEVPWGLWSSADPFSRNNPWLGHLTKILGKSEFILLSATQMCGSFLAVFVQRGVLPFVDAVETSHTPTGYFGLFGTKGVVSIRFQLHGTWFCFISSHFAAHVWNIMTRIWEYDTILDYHKYSDSSKILDHDYVFWFGDLNFRIEDISRESIDRAIKMQDFSRLFEYDQLSRLQRKGLIFTDFEESGLYFPPSYKKVVGKPNEYIECPKRLPSYCDRVLYSSAPSPHSIHVLDYADLPTLSTSDHTPVFLQANVTIPRPLSNSVVRFGPVMCDSLPMLPSDSPNIILSCTFSFADGFTPSERDEIVLYQKYFARLDDDIHRWPASEFLPLRAIRLDLVAEIEKHLRTGWYCLVYLNNCGPKTRVVGMSDYFGVGDVSSDDDDFGDDIDFINGNDSSDSGEMGLGGEDEIEGVRAGSVSQCRPKSAKRRRNLPPRPASARGHYDDLSLTPGAASSRSDSVSNSFSVTPTMLTPSLPVIDAWPASLDGEEVHGDEFVNESIPLDIELIIDDDDDDDNASDLLDDDDLVVNNEDDDDDDDVDQDEAELEKE